MVEQEIHRAPVLPVLHHTGYFRPIKTCRRKYLVSQRSSVNRDTDTIVMITAYVFGVYKRSKQGKDI